MTFTRIGDRIEATVRQPTPGTLRVQLMTAQACAEANKLLADPKSGWRLATPANFSR